MKKEGKKELRLYGYIAWMMIALLIATQYLHGWVYDLIDGSFMHAAPIANLSVLVAMIVANYGYIRFIVFERG